MFGSGGGEREGGCVVVEVERGREDMVVEVDGGRGCGSGGGGRGGRHVSS